jgi:hypothetical protein
MLPDGNFPQRVALEFLQRLPLLRVSCFALMPAKKKSASGRQVDLYEKLVATNPKVERKGAANPYTAINGNMFSLLHGGTRMALRLPEDERAAFQKKYKTKLFEAYGTVMPEYVAVPDPLLEKTPELKKYFDISYKYAQSLRPKPTTKNK